MRFLREVGTAIMEAEPIAAEVDEASPHLIRVKTITAFALARLQETDPELIPISPLDNMQGQLTQMISAIQSFTSSRNISFLRNANQNADLILTSLAQLISFVSVPEVEHVRDAVVSFRDALGQHLRFAATDIAPLRDSVQQLTSRTEQLSNDVSSQRAQLATLSTDHQAQFSTAQEKRLTDFANAQQQRADDFTKSEAERAAQSDEATHTFTSQHETLLEDFAAKHQTAMQEASTAFAQTAQSLRSSADQTLKKIDEYRAEAEKLLGIIGNVGITSGHQKEANHARTLSWVWQGLTLLSMAGLIYVAWHAFLPTINKQQAFNWGAFAGRVFVSLTFGVFAGYSAHQATQYQERERRNRKIALELQSLGPYLASLPEEKQQEFRLLMADRTFGRDEPMSASQPPTNVTELLKSKELQDLIINIVKTMK